MVCRRFALIGSPTLYCMLPFFGVLVLVPCEIHTVYFGSFFQILTLSFHRRQFIGVYRQKRNKHGEYIVRLCLSVF